MAVACLNNSFSILILRHIVTKVCFKNSYLVATDSNMPVVSASETVETVNWIKQVEGAIGRKAIENKILNRVVVTT